VRVGKFFTLTAMRNMPAWQWVTAFSVVICFSCSTSGFGKREVALPPSLSHAGELHRAMVTVEYYDVFGKAPDSAIPWYMPLDQAVDVIKNDTSFGKNRRAARAYMVIQKLRAFHPRDPRIANLPTLPQPLPSPDCCSDIDRCLVRHTSTGALTAAIAFTIDVPLQYDVVAPILEPQNWDEVEHTNFTDTFYVGESCPESYTNKPEPNAPDWKQGWNGGLYELYEYLCDDKSTCTYFENALRIEAVHEPKLRSFGFDYALCPNGSYGSKIATYDEVRPGALLRDCGHSGVQYDRPGYSRVQASKAVQFSNDICGGSCLNWVDTAMSLSMRVLAQETAIAVCHAQGVEPKECTGLTCRPMEDDDFNSMCRLTSLIATH
jgi:hypothetical protein